jgi:hypothetical protein
MYLMLIVRISKLYDENIHTAPSNDVRLLYEYVCWFQYW